MAKHYCNATWPRAPGRTPGVQERRRGAELQAAAMGEGRRSCATPGITGDPQREVPSRGAFTGGTAGVARPGQAPAGSSTEDGASDPPPSPRPGPQPRGSLTGAGGLRREEAEEAEEAPAAPGRPEGPAGSAAPCTPRRPGPPARKRKSRPFSRRRRGESERGGGGGGHCDCALSRGCGQGAPEPLPPGEPSSPGLRSTRRSRPRPHARGGSQKPRPWLGSHT